MTETTPTGGKPKNRAWVYVVVAVVAAAVTFGVTALLTNMFEKKTEASNGTPPVVTLTSTTYDAATWGQNYPLEYAGFKATADFTPSNHNTALVPVAGPRAAVVEKLGSDPETRTETTASKIEQDPRLVTLWKGYAFALDYRHLRGHEWMLTDQRLTLRVLLKDQPGACLNCHASTVPVMEELGDGDAMAGFAAMNKLAYADATAMAANPIQCIDCHDPETMNLRITRPALINGLKALKASEGIADYDVNTDATVEEMRTYVCAQCHVEYYFAGDDKTLTFPWQYGTDINDVWQYYQEIGFTDFENAISGAKVVKAQHPEFETWSAGIHAANGVSCADCHMAYVREGAQKVTNHDITDPLENIATTCGVCHTDSEEAIRAEVWTIQNRFVDSRDRALDATVALINDIAAAKEAGVAEDRIALAQEYQNMASFYVDYSYSENSFGFHASDYMQRILSQSLDAARKGQLALLGQTKAQLEPSEVAQANATAAADMGII
ncbi:MAG: ammonia-forming cytochrome c nitrite reductase subunit c552 [Propionibacteriaceae bacterium]|jgi:nitrite reductase (cytochrome c-552)|nr:ammonia-forming cytochrome c nitrite reductase subunit c552 [Propionibacteriaceae bacterium]